MAVATLTPGQFDLVYNMLSLGLASMAASTVFFFLRLGSFAERYKAALCFTGLVTFIAMYHYFRIFDSFVAAYTPCEIVDGEINHSKCSPELYNYTATGIPFNDAYRYVDWLLTVPLLLIEIVLVMKLSEAETFSRCVTLGVSSALMIANGYPGEITGDPMQRCVFWWCTYPIVFVMPMLGGSSNGKAGLSSTAMVGIQVGYTFSDIISKCGVGYLVYRIGLAKSMIDHSNGKAGFNMDEVEALAQDEEEA